MYPKLLITAVLAVATPPSNPVSVGRMKLDELVRYSDAIVLARVTKVVDLDRAESERSSPDSFGWRHEKHVTVAEAEVLRVIKGEPTATSVHFLAQSTWTCDISGATVGETDLLFLHEASWPAEEGASLRGSLQSFTGGKLIFDLMHSGRGRMPLRKVNERDYVTYWDEVAMPKDLVNVDGPDAQYASFIRSTPLADLEALVKASAKKHGPKLRASEFGSTPPGKDWVASIWNDGFETRWIENKSFENDTIASERAAALWSAIENDSYLGWPDAALSNDSKQPSRTLEVATDGHRRRLHLPNPAQLAAPLEPKLEQEIRLWIALRDLIDDADASDSRAAYRALLSK